MLITYLIFVAVCLNFVLGDIRNQGSQSRNGRDWTRWMSSFILPNNYNEFIQATTTRSYFYMNQPQWPTRSQFNETGLKANSHWMSIIPHLSIRKWTTTTQRMMVASPNIFPIGQELKMSPRPHVNGDLNTGKTVHKNRALLPEHSCGVDYQYKIVGGEKTEVGELPWMAIIYFLNRISGYRHPGCGGVLIHRLYVLTAAHCVTGPEISRSTRFQVRLGDHDVDKNPDCRRGQCSPPPQDINVARAVVHEKYHPRKLSPHDIALLRLERNANINAYVRPICLPLDNLMRANYEGKNLLVAGWGRLGKHKDLSNVLLKTELPVTPFSKCERMYRERRINLESSQMCAGGVIGKDSCKGDSGGPLMSLDRVGSRLLWHVTGVVSFGPGDCGNVTTPGIYTKVTSHIDWILDNIEQS